MSGYAALLLTLPAVAGLVGATLRIPNSFMIAICGGRNVKFMTTVLLILPAIGAGIALQNPATPFSLLILLAAMSGVGGGAFASSMSNISFFFPKRVQGLGVGPERRARQCGRERHAVLDPLGHHQGTVRRVSEAIHSNSPQDGAAQQLWIQNAALVWVPIMTFLAILAWLFMNNLPQHQCGPTPGGDRQIPLVNPARLHWRSGWRIAADQRLGRFSGTAQDLHHACRQHRGHAGIDAFPDADRHASRIFNSQFAIFNNKHNWAMTWLYTMTFGSFIGYANAFPVLIDVVFGQVAVGPDGTPLLAPIANANAPITSNFIWIGAGIGALIRPVGGWLSDKLGGARVTQWDTWVMVAATILAGYFVYLARLSPTPEKYFIPFLVTFVILFATTGIGNGSTFRMIPIIFPKEQAGPVLGWTSAVAAYGAYLDSQGICHADQGGNSGIRSVRICRLLRQLPGRELVVLCQKERGNQVLISDRLGSDPRVR